LALDLAVAASFCGCDGLPRIEAGSRVDHQTVKNQPAVADRNDPDPEG
jgi:hypothetical protein